MMHHTAIDDNWEVVEYQTGDRCYLLVSYS